MKNLFFFDPGLPTKTVPLIFTSPLLNIPDETPNVYKLEDCSYGTIDIVEVVSRIIV